MMKFLQRYALPILIVITIFFMGWIFGHRNGRQLTEGQIGILIGSQVNDKLTRVVSYIGSDYIEPITKDSLAELAIPAILEKLDPHSAYIPAREFKQVEEPLQGEFDGIGVVFNMATDTVIILNVIPSGPSQKAGVLAGDRIIKVNDTLIAGQKMAQTEVMKRLRGPRGTKVDLTLERQGIDAPVVVTVTRDAIPLNSVEATVMLTDEVGFIRLSQFARTSFREVTEAVDTLRGQGMKSLILDLRGNSGGFLDQAILIANQFLERGKLIVYTEDRNKQRIRQYSDGKGSATDLEIAVLIDEGSASSSEILAGALQDNDRGTIIGRRSFGKGLVQSQIPFDDGSALRLTVAKYFTPTGRSIQKPYTAGDEKGYNMDIVNRYNHNEFFSADSIHFADSLKFTTPKGKVVYGGGGIMPDIFIPLDTTNMSKYYLEVSGRNILYRFTIEYADSHRKELSSAKSLKDLEAMFAADKGMFDRFISYAAKNGVKPNYRQIAQSRAIMESQLRAYIARNSEFDSSAFYYFIRPIDNTLLTAIKTLENDD
ncbi:MAG: S41 family peptidase [Rikenellaceae bacterium]|nr:S41 family peptidase [Rikenellaceae bacterium]